MNKIKLSPEARAYFRACGALGGRSTSPAKRAASQAGIARARAALAAKRAAKHASKEEP